MTRRRLWAVGFGLWVLICGLVAPVSAGERYAVVISGVSGGDTYAEQQRKWRSELIVFLTTGFAFADANVVVLDDASDGSTRATGDNVRRLFGDLRRRLTRGDTLLVILLGHGTYDGSDAKFNLVGPDLHAGEWQQMLDGVPGRMVVVNTTASSFPFLEKLSRAGRIVITATDSPVQRFATTFPEHFIQALATRSSDTDKNGRVSVWEAFTAASAGVRRHYEQRGQLATERPLLDDNGDGMGREAGAPGEDGHVARTVYLDPDPDVTGGDAAMVALEGRRKALESQLEGLKTRKASLSDEQYRAELEKILIELATITREIRRRS